MSIFYLNLLYYISPVVLFRNNKLIKGKALRKHSLHEKTVASVLLKLFISSYEYITCVFLNCDGGNSEWYLHWNHF